MDKMISFVGDFLSSMLSWFKSLKTWVKVLVISSIVFGAVTSVLAYSISKRNRIIRENKRLIQKQAYQLKIQELEMKKKDELLRIAKLSKKDNDAQAKIALGEANIKKLEGKQSRLKEKQKSIERVDLKKDKDLKAVDKMSAEEQIKKMNQVLGDTL